MPCHASIRRLPAMLSRCLPVCSLLVAAVAAAGPPCDDGSCGNGSCGRSCGGLRAEDYRCVVEAKSVDKEKDCYVVEQEAVCIPGVRKPSLAELRGGDACGACGGRLAGGQCTDCMACDSACDAGRGDGCRDGCGNACGSGSGLSGLLSRLCQSGCRVRIVNRLTKDTVPNGTDCEYSWSAERCGGGGRHDGPCGDNPCSARCLP